MIPRHLILLQASPVERWRWLGARIRWGLTPCTPGTLAYFLAAGNQACANGLIEPWELAEHNLRLLLDSATDRLLPWHWRVLCLDWSYRPLQSLESLALGSPVRREALQRWRRQVADADMSPGISPDDDLSRVRH